MQCVFIAVIHVAERLYKQEGLKSCLWENKGTVRVPLYKIELNRLAGYRVKSVIVWPCVELPLIANINIFAERFVSVS